jgi:hypothetical protein
MPKDPMILLSYVNTKLRDEFGNLDELCAAEEVSPDFIKEKLKSVGFIYDEEMNRFV